MFCYNWVTVIHDFSDLKDIGHRYYLNASPEELLLEATDTASSGSDAGFGLISPRTLNTFDCILYYGGYFDTMAKRIHWRWLD